MTTPTCGNWLRTSFAFVAMTFSIPTLTSAQTKVPIAVFPFPSLANVTADIIVAKGFDKANGIEAVPVTFGTGGALWAGVAKGEVLAHSMSPFQLQKMRADGVPIALYGTLVGMSTIQVITRNPEVKKFSDLKGRSFAATVGFAEFDYLQIYAKRLGFNLRRDVSIVDATTALAQAQLQANRVDAIMAWEPSATMILSQIPDARVVLTGDEAWKFVTGEHGWDLLLFVRTDLVKDNPGILLRLIKMYGDFAEFVTKDPDEADAIISSNKYFSKNLPAGTISSAVRAKRLVLDVKPSWDPVISAQIWKMLQLGLEDGHIPSLPDKTAVINSPNP
jgi:ABC-type nitrate/sulfonate/bicarbonate transport system substrate-binding protein